MSIQQTQSVTRDQDQADQSSTRATTGQVRNSDQALMADSMYPRVVTIRGELVEAKSRNEHNEALALIDRIEGELGADLDGEGGMRALVQFYRRPAVRKEMGLDKAPDPSTRRVTPWALVDLRAIETVMVLVAPALKRNPREALRFAKIDDDETSLTEARYVGDDERRDTDYMIMTPEWSKQEGDNYAGAPPDNREKTVAHEIAHDLFSHKTKDWERRVKWYRDEPGAERPPSAWLRPAEDIAESVALYLMGKLDGYPERKPIVEEYLAEVGLLEHVRAQHALRARGGH